MKKLMKIIKEKTKEIGKSVSMVKMKIKSPKEKKVGINAYLVLVGMIIMTLLTTYLNIIKYVASKDEDYEKYTSNENVIKTIQDNSQMTEEVVQVINEKIDVEENIQQEIDSKIYDCVQSSIYEVASIIENDVMIPSFSVVRNYSETEVVYYENVGIWKVHLGVDIVFEDGRVVSFTDGIVQSVYDDVCLGNTVIVEKDDVVIKYSSLSDDIKVKVGDNVKKGQEIGYIGSSAEYEKNMEKHLHMEVAKGDETINPSILGINVQECE